jgi:hypothetical protein
LLFADTLIEDDDLYRFVVEAGANILGVSERRWRPLESLWKTIPSLNDLKARKAHLARLRTAAMLAVPGLSWVCDGRTPWEVFRKARFIGNTRAAICSHLLKQDVCRNWLQANRRPEDTIIILGIDWQERHRFEGKGDNPGARQLWLPWTCVAPMCDEPYLSKYEVANWLEHEGIDPPALYDLGFVHNNCGGFCIKAGQAHFKRLLDTMPERYEYHAQQEQQMREFLDKDVAILRDRRGGQTKPLPMVDFRERQQQGEGCDMTDHGGCGCFSDP